MALGAIILAVLVLVGVGTSSLRFAPKFYGREEPPKRLPPGARPPLLARTARPVATVGATRPSVPQSAQARATTAVAERPAPAEREAPAPAPATEAPAAEAAPAAETTPADEADEAAAEPAAEEATAPAQPTEAPSGESAVQADAEAEAEAPEAAEQPAEAEAPEAAEQPAEAEAEAPEAAEQPAEAAPTAQPAAHGGASALDQETFDRVLEEQLAKGVDRRVAEGRARAAAVVAARKKAQG
jgi:FtsZ-interacting cell division protein ZipA